MLKHKTVEKLLFIVRNEKCLEENKCFFCKLNQCCKLNQSVTGWFYRQIIFACTLHLMIVNKRSFSEWRFETVTFSEQTTRVKTYTSRVKTHYTCKNMTEIWIIGIRIEWNQISRIDFHSRASEISMCGVLSFFPLFNVPHSNLQ